MKKLLIFCAILTIWLIDVVTLPYRTLRDWLFEVETTKEIVNKTSVLRDDMNA